MNLKRNNHTGSYGENKTVNNAILIADKVITCNIAHITKLHHSTKPKYQMTGLLYTNIIVTYTVTCHLSTNLCLLQFCPGSLKANFQPHNSHITTIEAKNICLFIYFVGCRLLWKATRVEIHRKVSSWKAVISVKASFTTSSSSKIHRYKML